MHVSTGALQCMCQQMITGWGLCAVPSFPATPGHGSSHGSGRCFHGQRLAASNCPLCFCCRPQRVRTHSPTPFLRLMVDLLMFFADTYRTVFKVGCFGPLLRCT